MWRICARVSNLLFCFILVALIYGFYTPSDVNAATFNCATTSSGTVNWTAAVWTNCNSTYPGGTGAPDIYNVSINSTAAVTLNLDVSPATIGTITIIGNGVNHIINFNGFTLTTSGDITINAPTSNTKNNTIAVDTGTLNAGGNIILNSGTASTRISQITASTGTINITGNVSYSGTAAAAKISISGAGNVIAASIGAGGYFSETTGGSLKLTGAAPILQVGGNYTYENVEFAGSGTATLSTTSAVINGALTITSGTLDFGANAATITGGTTVTSAGTITFSSATNIKTFTGLVTLESSSIWNNSGNSPVTFQGGITNNGGTFTAGSGTQTFDATQSISGSAGITIPNMTVNRNYIVTNNLTSQSVALNVTTALAGAGTLRQGTNGYLILGGTVSISTLDATTSTPNTVNYNGSGTPAILGTTYDYLIFSGTGNGSIDATTVVNKDLTISNGTFTVGAYSLTVTGQTSITGTLAITSSTGTKTFTGLVTINLGGTWNNSGNEAITLDGGIDNDGTFTSGTGTYTLSTNQTISGNNSLTFSATAGTTAISIGAGIIVQNSGTVIVTSGNIVGASAASEWQNNASSTLQIGGTLLSTGILDSSANGNLVNYSGSSAQTIKIPQTSYHDLTYSGSNTATLGNTVTVDGNFTISSGTVALSTYTLNIGGDFSNSSNFSADTGTVTFIDAAQTSTIYNPAGGTNFNSFTVNTASKALVFDQTDQTNISGTLTLNGGACNTMVTLSSNLPGTKFNINATGTKNVTFVDVTDSNAVTAISATDSKGSNYTNWTFGATTCGSLTLSVPVSATMNSVSISYPAPSSTGNLGTVTATDTRGTNVGWSLTATSTNFTSGGYTIAVTNFTVDPNNSTLAVVSGSPTGVSAGTSHTFTGTSDPTSIITASSGNGTGQYTIDPDLSLTIPVGSYSGNYSATLTLTIQ